MAAGRSKIVPDRRWSDPALEMRADDAMPQAREHSAICYDPEEPMESPDTWEPPVRWRRMVGRLLGCSF